MTDEMLNIGCKELTDLLEEFPEEAAAIIEMLSAAEEGCVEDPE